MDQSAIHAELLLSNLEQLGIYCVREGELERLTRILQAAHSAQSY